MQIRLKVVRKVDDSQTDKQTNRQTLLYSQTNNDDCIASLAEVTMQNVFHFRVTSSSWTRVSALEQNSADDPCDSTAELWLRFISVHFMVTDDYVIMRLRLYND